MTQTPKGALRADAPAGGFLTLSVEASAPAISRTVACAHTLGKTDRTKAYLFIDSKLGAHASRGTLKPSEMHLLLRQQSICQTEQTARTAISRGYAAQGQVLESTIGLAVRPKGFGQSLTTYTRAIWRKRFGSDTLLLLT